MSSSQPGLRIESNPKWIRGFRNGVLVVDSRDSKFVWEIPYYPAWYFPLAGIRGELVDNGRRVDSPERGAGTRYDLVVDGMSIPDAAWRHLESRELGDLVRIEWDAVDSWFEEDIEVFVHPRSPEARIDALRSSRHVRVSIDGVSVADSSRGTVLYETGLPPRYYLPQTDVQMDLLTPTDTTTACPYKGWAQYWNVTVNGTVHEDLVWGYRTPLPESAAIAGLVCFYNEKVDIEIDGVAVTRPETKFA